VNKNDFDKKFSLAKTLTNIRNTSDATTHSSNAQLLNSLLKTLNVDSKINGFVKMNLQKRAQETALSGLVNNMLPSAIFNRKFSKLPWTVNECVRTHLTCAMGVVGEINGCR
jgi:hypothetical protein